MKHYILKRRYFDYGTFSTLHREDGSKVCCFVERPFLNNAPNVSCVVEGTYTLYPHDSPKFGECYALESKELGVTRYENSLRTHVLIHKGNTPSDLQGCLSPGVAFGVVRGDWGVVQSGIAFRALMTELNGESAQLTILKD